MAEVTIREGGAIPHKQAAALFVALGRGRRLRRVLAYCCPKLLHHWRIVS